MEEKIPLQLAIVYLFRSHTNYLRKTLKNTGITIGQFPVVVETHKHETISQKELADILFLSEGRIKAQGTHQELLKKSREYKQLYEAELRDN